MVPADPKVVADCVVSSNVPLAHHSITRESRLLLYHHLPQYRPTTYNFPGINCFSSVINVTLKSVCLRHPYPHCPYQLVISPQKFQLLAFLFYALP